LCPPKVHMGLSDMLPGPLDPFWITLRYKMLATAALVVSVSMLVERVGPFLGAMIATLPISAGPALVFVAMDRGPAFLEASARTGLPAFAVRRREGWRRVITGANGRPMPRRRAEPQAVIARGV